MNSIFNPLLNETFIFRPLNEVGQIIKPSLRYANNTWIPDDGEYDLAFIFDACAFSVYLPTNTNILWTWIDHELEKKWLPEYLHRNVRGHHTMTVDNTPLDDKYRWYDFPDDNPHPNEVAHRQAMKKCCEIYGCASGRGPTITNGQYQIGKYFLPDEYIKRGLLKIQRTMQSIVIPEKLECVLCADNGKGHLIKALKGYKEDLEYRIENNKETISKAQSTIYDCEDENEKSKETLEETIKELHDLGVKDADKD